MRADPRMARRSGQGRSVLGGLARILLRSVVLAFALLGLLVLTRGMAVQHVRGVPADGVPIGVGEPQFPLMATMLTGAGIAPGHRVDVLLNGDATYPRLWEDLKSAQHSITLQLSYGAPGRMARTLGDILRERVKAGVRVWVLYDAFGTMDIPADELATLRAVGAQVEPFRPLKISTLHLVQNRSHVRGIVIDSRIGWTGGFGIDDKWFGDGRSPGSWRETNVRFEGPAVRQLQAAFAAAWTEATGELFTGLPTVASAKAGPAVAGLLSTSPGLGSTPAERFFALSIAGARRTLYITNANVAPDRSFVELLAAAARRGVDVRILIGGPLTDVHVVRYAGRASYDTLFAAGVRVYEWRPTTLHAKTFVVDGEWFTIGSLNFDNRSMALNDEATLMVLDHRLGAEMDRIFLDDLQYAQEITASGFRERPWFERVLERGARLITRLL